jgi:hypothetical protein
MAMKRAYVTMLTRGDGHVPGVEALGASLRASGTRAPMVVMATRDVSPRVRARLVTQGWWVRDVEPLYRSGGEARPLFPRFSHGFVKLRAWQLTEFDKVVYLDPDTLVLRNVDELFERPELSAAPDSLWPDRFDSGVMVLAPSEKTFEHMLAAAPGAGTCYGGEQGFLNAFFPGWYRGPEERRLPVEYNLSSFVPRLLAKRPELSCPAVERPRILHYALRKPWRRGLSITGASRTWWRVHRAARPDGHRWWKRGAHLAEDLLLDLALEVILD